MALAGGGRDGNGSGWLVGYGGDQRDGRNGSSGLSTWWTELGVGGSVLKGGKGRRWWHTSGVSSNVRGLGGDALFVVVLAKVVVELVVYLVLLMVAGWLGSMLGAKPSVVGSSKGGGECQERRWRGGGGSPTR